MATLRAEMKVLRKEWAKKLRATLRAELTSVV